MLYGYGELFFSSQGHSENESDEEFDSDFENEMD